MKLRKTYLREKKPIDIRNYSRFHQEEVLLKAGVEFTVESVNYIIEKRIREISKNDILFNKKDYYKTPDSFSWLNTRLYFMLKEPVDDSFILSLHNRKYQRERPSNPRRKRKMSH
jgi:hypothetical protein